LASVNKVIIVGNLGKDPELRYTQSGVAFCNISVATADQWTNQGGQRQEKTEWHRITVWKKQAENCAKYLRKGSSAYIEGRLQTRSWEESGQKRYSTDIVAEVVKFLGTPVTGRNDPQSMQSHSQSAFGDHGSSLDDVPF
jgi:single-strand DNA-binding protein